MGVLASYDFEGSTNVSPCVILEGQDYGLKVALTTNCAARLLASASVIGYVSCYSKSCHNRFSETDLVVASSRSN